MTASRCCRPFVGALVGLLAVLFAPTVAHGQRLSVALGGATDRYDHYGAQLQLAARFFDKGPTSARLEATYTQVRLPGYRVMVSEDEAAWIPARHDRTYHIGGSLQLRVLRTRIAPYLTVGAGMYARNMYTGGYNPGVNAGVGAEARISGAALFGELRGHRLIGEPRLLSRRPAELVALVAGIRF